jgi:hypothetical protein
MLYSTETANDTGDIVERDDFGDDEVPVRIVTLRSAGTLLPMMEALEKLGAMEVWYSFLPGKGEKSEPNVSRIRVLGQEPIADFLGRLRERKSQEDKMELN